MPEVLDAVVIGTGVAGLTAARQLARVSRSVILLEARDRVGGRTLTESLNGVAVDLGGQWVGPGQDRIKALLRELGLETFPQHHRGTKLARVDGRLLRYEDGDLPFGVVTKLDLLRATRRLDRYARQVPDQRPWAAGNARGWDAMTLESWKRGNLFTRGGRFFLDLATRAVTTSEPGEISFLYFLNYLRSGGGLDSLISIRGGAQEERVRGGMQQVSSALAAQLGGRLVLSAPVRAIEQHDDHVVRSEERRVGKGG